MTERLITSKHELNQLIKLLESKKPPFTVTIVAGKHRTTSQNRLQRLWMNEISEQKGDLTPEEVRGYCKLAIGVPILRAENERFREEYDRIIKPHSYEDKMRMMMEPLDFPITRLFTTAQKTQYLDLVYQHWSEQGVNLTRPER